MQTSPEFQAPPRSQPAPVANYFWTTERLSQAAGKLVFGENVRAEGMRHWADWFTHAQGHIDRCTNNLRVMDMAKCLTPLIPSPPRCPFSFPYA